MCRYLRYIELSPNKHIWKHWNYISVTFENKSPLLFGSGNDNTLPSALTDQSNLKSVCPAVTLHSSLEENEYFTSNNKNNISSSVSENLQNNAETLINERSNENNSSLSSDTEISVGTNKRSLKNDERESKVVSPEKKENYGKIQTNHIM